MIIMLVIVMTMNEDYDDCDDHVLYFYPKDPRLTAESREEAKKKSANSGIRSKTFQ